MSFESATETAGRLHPDAEVAGRGANGNGHVNGNGAVAVPPPLRADARGAPRPSRCCATTSR